MAKTQFSSHSHMHHTQNIVESFHGNNQSQINRLHEKGH